jgi:hypothetical protein
MANDFYAGKSANSQFTAHIYATINVRGIGFAASDQVSALSQF